MVNVYPNRENQWRKIGLPATGFLPWYTGGVSPYQAATRGTRLRGIPGMKDFSSSGTLPSNARSDAGWIGRVESLPGTVSRRGCQSHRNTARSGWKDRAISEIDPPRLGRIKHPVGSQRVCEQRSRQSRVPLTGGAQAQSPPFWPLPRQAEHKGPMPDTKDFSTVGCLAFLRPKRWRDGRNIGSGRSTVYRTQKGRAKTCARTSARTHAESRQETH